MAGLMEMFQSPELWQWVGNVGAGMNRAGRGQGFDISQGNQQLFQSLADRQTQQQIAGLMDQFNLSPQQRGLLSNIPVQAQQRILADLAFPQTQDRKIVKGADGYQYYADTGERVLPNVQGGAGGFEGTGMQAQAYNILMDPNASPQMKAAAQHYFSQPRPQMTESGLVMVPGQVPQFPQQGGIDVSQLPAPPSASEIPADAGSGQYSERPAQWAPPPPDARAIVPGTEKNPNKMAAEGAGRYTGAKRIMERAGEGDWKLLLDEDGSIDRVTLAQINNGVPMTDKAQKAYNFLWSMIDTKLRIMTGAAAPDSEVARQVKQLLPATLSFAGVDAYKSAVENELKFFEEFIASQENVPSGAKAPDISDKSFESMSDEELMRQLGLQ